MLRTVASVAIVLAISIGGGAASVWYALERSGGLGALNIGAWTAYPLAGTPQADPYSKARVAREAELPLGGAEGLSFVATRDAAGAALRRDCTYRIEGVMPIARLWTLFAADATQNALRPAGERPAGLSSFDVLRNDDNSMIVTAGRSIVPGNWLAVSGTGPMSFVLNLYDTPVASSESIGGLDLPQVLKVGCDE